MTERQMEDLLAAYPNDFFFDYQLVLLDRQGALEGVGRFDLLFEDRHKTKFLMELKSRPLNYADASQVAHYHDELKRRGQGNVVMWLIAPRIPTHVREFLDDKCIEYTEIHVAEFLRVAERHNYAMDIDRASAADEFRHQGTQTVTEKGGLVGPYAAARHHTPDVVPVDIQDLLQMEIAPREYVVDQLLPFRGKCVIFGPKGTERTHFVAQLVYSIASGTRFFQWDVPQPRQVVHVQGDPIGATLDAFQRIVDLNGHPPARGSWRVVNRDLRPGHPCRIDSAEGRNGLQATVSTGTVLVLDDALSLWPGIERLGSSEWGRVSDWANDLARSGVSTVIVSPPQKGKRTGSACMAESDSAVTLRPGTRPAEDDLNFEVEVETIRGQAPNGPRNQPFGVGLSQAPSGVPVWKIQFLREVTRRRAEQMLREGADPKEVAGKTGLSRFAVHRIRRRLEPAESPEHEP